MEYVVKTGNEEQLVLTRGQCVYGALPTTE